MKLRPSTLIVMLCMIMVCMISCAESSEPSLVLVNGPMTEGQDFIFDVEYGDHRLAILSTWIIKDGTEYQLDGSTVNQRHTIPSEEFIHFEAGAFTLGVQVYDNTAGGGYTLTVETSYERPNAISSPPKLIGNTDGMAVLYYPGANTFVTDGGELYEAENGYLELYEYDEDGRYAAVINGKRTKWLYVDISEYAELPQMEIQPELILADSYPRGTPITFTVTGDPDAYYAWYINDWFNMGGSLPGPGNYSIDLGGLDYSDDGWNGYCLQIKACKDGYEPAYADGAINLTDQALLSAPAVTLLSQPPYYMEQPIRFRVYKENATAYMAWISEHTERLVPAEELCEFTFSPDDGNSIRFSAKVNGQWTEYSEPIYLTVDWLDSLEEPVLSAPRVALIGDQIQLYWNAVSGADKYRVYAYCGRSVDAMEYMATVTGTSATVPVLTSVPDIMWVDVTAYGSGYAKSRSESLPVFIKRSTGKLILPDSVTEVGDEAFAGVKASRIVIPNSCGSIGSRAFANTKNLVKIRIPASVTTIAANAFEGSGVLTIETTAGSTAEQYARNHQIPVELIR